jgi:C1A family cysteine protease
LLLSEQQIVDCTRDFNFGCDGGNMQETFKFIIESDGLLSDNTYPYITNDTQSCQTHPNSSVATVSGYDYIYECEDALLKAVATIGPISVSFHATELFRHYEKGVYNEPKCNKLTIGRHAALIVGFESENGIDYWLVKNSWSATWGDFGYVKMARNKNNQCGIASEAIVPTGVGMNGFA